MTHGQDLPSGFISHRRGVVRLKLDQSMVMPKRMNRAVRGLAAALTLVSAGLFSSPLNAASFAVQQYRLGSNVTLIRVYDLQTGRTIWTRRTRHPLLLRWSADRTALAVLGERIGESDHDWYDLWVWRNGERVRKLRSLAPFRRLEIVRDLIWSPDKRRLLLLGPYSQGEADQGFNRLWCLRLRGERAQLLTNEAVTRAQWV
jgi:hypothetical protein